MQWRLGFRMLRWLLEWSVDVIFKAEDDGHSAWVRMYTVFQKKTPTHIVGYKLRNSCLILIIFDIKIPDII